MPSSAPPPAVDDEAITIKCCAPIAALAQPVEVGEVGTGSGHAGSSAFCVWPLLGPLLFENETSDARDHCANERTFLSYLRLAVYMAILAVAITLSFHLKLQPTDLERRMAKPLGVIFWVLSVVTLFVGVGNYISEPRAPLGRAALMLETETVNKYGRKAAIVQTGWRTQLVLVIIAVSIIGTCVVLLVVTKLQVTDD
ncbi:hypothetical protein TOPH_02200 [Tolypocladium ophioglossoides CBS 100239]|uniref:DUF202 domain-containing protein n=1 Tax=Tolypocladium ophioglossoides (strain CBS 100239) TaxID=1163406 RepID=A0A0L0NFX3_TOLOC|nr:hypothetical protein TOPH_02200 [Tolypocladium ophioglossoides CBS 100239]